jgi:peptidoglycan/LPS O-acetylase OafA/YrhL
VTTLLAAAGERSTADRRHFRPDVEGLRAVAILLVVLNHVGVPGVGGGYVGVDVFFVISGYLITSQLVRDRVPIHVFYARRALRLLPAATTVTVVSLVGAWLWLSPLLIDQVVKDALAAAGYVSNLQFAARGTDYLAADAAPSPFQHFWSLAVEEQFYLFWPLVLLVRRRRLIWALVGFSLVLCVTETHRSAPWAYFGTHTRVWELGTGALLAIHAPRPIRRLGWMGLAAIVVAAVAYGPDTSYPGAFALLPVAGAAAVIAGRGAAVLACRPFQIIGRLSYGWYLWHWPLLMIIPVTGVPPRLVVAAAALGLAWLTHRVVENPIRFHPALRSRARYGVLVGAVCAAVVVTTAATVDAFPREIPHGAAAVRGPIGPAAIRAGAALRTIPSNMRPTLAMARKELPKVYQDLCNQGIEEITVRDSCVYGDLSSDTIVVLLGDSHAAHWFPALELLALRRHWRLVSLTKSSCTAADVLVWADALRRPYTECQTWRSAALARIAQLKPRLVVTSSAFSYRPADPAASWRAGWRHTFDALTATGARVVAIADTPAMGSPVPACLAQHPRAVWACNRPVAAATADAQRPVMLGLAGGRVTVVDPIPWLCVSVCPAVLGNLLVYRDAQHLTPRIAVALAPALESRLGL